MRFTSPPSSFFLSLKAPIPEDSDDSALGAGLLTDAPLDVVELSRRGSGCWLHDGSSVTFRKGYSSSDQFPLVAVVIVAEPSLVGSDATSGETGLGVRASWDSVPPPVLGSTEARISPVTSTISLMSIR